MSDNPCRECPVLRRMEDDPGAESICENSCGNFSPGAVQRASSDECPHCGSSHVEEDGDENFVTYTCLACRHEWYWDACQAAEDSYFGSMGL